MVCLPLFILQVDEDEDCSVLRISTVYYDDESSDYTEESEESENEERLDNQMNCPLRQTMIREKFSKEYKPYLNSQIMTFRIERAKLLPPYQFLEKPEPFELIPPKTDNRLTVVSD